MPTTTTLKESAECVASESATTRAGLGKTEVAQSLAVRIRQMETMGRQRYPGATSSGCSAIDERLPGGGYAKGSMVEFLRSGVGSGAMSLALVAAKQAMAGGKFLLIVDPARQFYPPAAQALGIPLERMIVIHPVEYADTMWSIEQALRCPGIAAVVASIDRLDDRRARRWQLAAEEGGGLGLWVRDFRSARGQPSWSDIQWFVQPRPAPKDAGDINRRWLELSLLRCRGGVGGGSFLVVLENDGVLHMETNPQARAAKHGELANLLSKISQNRKKAQRTA